MAANAGSILVLLDLSAAFDTIDHHILLKRLQHTFGVCNSALTWFKSYVTDITENVFMGGSKSRTHTVTCEVPQGLVLGPILFPLYLLHLCQIIRRFGV